ncbi:MAG: adenylate/guanylate cyclase domain-containing protein [Helicobacteraceae bacterium]|nr:adenylate/guanylate cyclase domain-containing protein [Helicobacteraceae bacterium]
MGKFRVSKKLFAAAAITAVIAGVVALLLAARLFDFLEFKTYDLRVSLLSSYDKPSDEIIVVLLDQKSIDWAYKERGWSWPWRREAYAQLIDYMRVANAKAVVFDVLFSEPSVYGSEDDERFAKASMEFGKTAQAIFLSRQGDLPNQGVSVAVVDSTAALPLDEVKAIGAQLPIEPIFQAARAVGSVNANYDSDGILRRIRLFNVIGDRALASLSVSALIANGAGGAIVYDGDRVVWGDHVIPVDRGGRTALGFKGELSRYAPYSAADILQSAEDYSSAKEPLLPPEDFAGKYVFFGFFAPGLYDMFNTPVASAYPGVGAHVTALDNLLSDSFIAQTSFSVDLLICLLFIGAMSFATLYSNHASIGIFALLLGALIALGAVAYSQGVWIPVAAPLAGIVAAFLIGNFYNYATEYAQRRFIKSAFSQYLSPAVIDELIDDPAKLKLGGQMRDMTAIFTDIRGFSTISEALNDPSRLVELLNFYLTRMSDIILANQGTIDKYEGDAIIAFFGAPIPTPEHAAFACRSAIEMKNAELEINREAIALGLITSEAIAALKAKGATNADLLPLYTRIGINSGDMVVGNMGTHKKMNYTIMGNAVNLAARLEGVNKQYSTNILISHETKRRLPEEFITRRVSRVRVVGINAPVTLYEPLGFRTQSPSLAALADRWNEGFAHYEQRRFDEAGAIFSELARLNDEDLTAKRYADLALAYAKCPPSDEQWNDGVDNLSSK